ncbi:TetR/AcrR family transcriptional regulator [Bifidobacterium sp. ESL0745]|uniref:TetR/AcrR family transcriptional regulator n=1 Tax=Bifidobacterium sp. ESL0745 TaxID=2983226 RepID=UPI0023F6F199|nr:TetR/AcrR family transcriptional regulator [Bifidobacterium sp. ESL0745]MDF7665925.1 TetR/AcrR family transcriptional regulator [Bifidobacterium sp. ESL0745]
MARPRKNQAGPNAVERMENVFWELIEKKPYNRITVENILVHSGVARTSFYYHYSNLLELAESALTHEVKRAEIFNLMDAILDGNVSESHLIEQSPVLKQRFRRMSLVAGPHGTYELVGLLKNLFMEVAKEELGMRKDSWPDMESETALEFMIGGILTLFGQWPELFERWPESFGDHPLGHATSMVSKIFKDLKNSMHDGSLTNFWKDDKKDVA